MMFGHILFGLTNGTLFKSTKQHTEKLTSNENNEVQSNLIQELESYLYTMPSKPL